MSGVPLKLSNFTYMIIKEKKNLYKVLKSILSSLFMTSLNINVCASKQLRMSKNYYMTLFCHY